MIDRRTISAYNNAEEVQEMESFPSEVSNYVKPAEYRIQIRRKSAHI